eukprot:gene15682-17263_t
MKESKLQKMNSCFQQTVLESQLFGMLLMALAGILLTLSNLFVQLAIAANKKRIPTLEVVFTRSVFQLFIAIPCMIVNKVRLPITDRAILPTVLIMGMCGFLSVTFIYFGIDKVPLGDATVIMFTSPVFTTMFAYMFLSESCTVVDGTCGLVSFVGVIVSSRPDFIFGNRSSSDVVSVMFPKKNMSETKKESLYYMGMGFVLLGAVFLSLYYVLTRKIGQTYHHLVNVFFPSLLGAICIPFIMLAFNQDFVVPNYWKAKLYIFLVGFTAYFGLELLARSLKLENAGPLILIRNLDIVYAFVFQYCFVGIAPSWWNIAGGIVVMASTSIVVAKRWSMWEKKRDKNYMQDNEDEVFLLSDNGGR